MLQHPNVVLLSTDKSETAVLQQILREHVMLTAAGNLRELRFHLENNDYDALFCAWSFHSGTWHDALEEVRKWHPDLPVIILSRIAEEKEWVQVLEAGAFDLLVPPYQERMVLAVLEQASASREARVSRSISPRLKESA